MKPLALTIIGAGSWGTALALHLTRKGLDIALWDKSAPLMHQLAEERVNRPYLPDYPFPDTLQIISSLEEAVKNANDILLAVPSYAFNKVLTEILPYLAPQARVLWATKGMDPDKNVLFHTLVEETLGKTRPFAVISGPSFAVEVAAGLPTAIAVASNNQDFKEEIMALFNSSTFHLFPTDDYIGVQLGATVKNILAIAVGISDGLGFDTNMRAMLMTFGLEEMARLGVAAGAKKDTFFGLSGLGDTVLTCTDSKSRNRRFGLALSQGHSVEEAEKIVGQSIEGKHNVYQIHQLAQKYHVSMPIVETVYNILVGKTTVSDGIKMAWLGYAEY